MSGRCSRRQVWMLSWYAFLPVRCVFARLMIAKFLAFFKMAIKFLVVTLFFALVVIKPVHDTFPDEKHPGGKDKDKDDEGKDDLRRSVGTFAKTAFDADYLWMYLVFAYFFTFLALYLIVSESRRIIGVRQEYLGSQSTVTDRTIRLSGIPPELREEKKIKEFIEDLQIGKVESVLLCKNWERLDKTMVNRMSILRRLEEAWTVHLGHRRVERSLETLPISQPPPPGPIVNAEDREDGALLGGGSNVHNHIVPYARTRPTTRIWVGKFNLQYRNIDAIDYYEEKLRRADAEIKALRKQEFEPCSLAFITLDSIAACVSIDRYGSEASS
jgi:hypothetical protein